MPASGNGGQLNPPLTSKLASEGGQAQKSSKVSKQLQRDGRAPALLDRLCPSHGQGYGPLPLAGCFVHAWSVRRLDRAFLALPIDSGLPRSTQPITPTPRRLPRTPQTLQPLSHHRQALSIHSIDCPPLPPPCRSLQTWPLQRHKQSIAPAAFRPVPLLACPIVSCTRRATGVDKYAVPPALCASFFLQQACPSPKSCVCRFFDFFLPLLCSLPGLVPILINISLSVIHFNHLRSRSAS